MREFLKDIFLAVLTAAVPMLTAYLVVFIRKAGDSAAANAESVMVKTYITEVTEAIAAAVAATNQTYVDSLKKTGKFDGVAQKEAAQKALEACMASISPAAQSFIEEAYGDIREYLTTRIEAEVRRQKNEKPLAVGIAEVSEVRESPDVAAVAATTAAATAAAVVQSTIPQMAPAVAPDSPQEDGCPPMV